ncbi:MAG: PAC2 family protein [Actinobacteria bacterium]|nr:PAC2 family protein [Actinomycetota bacterium]
MDDARVTFESNDIQLRSPILIAAFQGWNDAGESATFAARHLQEVWGAEKVASVDPEEFFDFQSVRPQVELVDGLTRSISWPSNELFGARLEGDNDALILIGTEPSLRWRAFSDLIVELVGERDVSLVVTLGALLADVPHSRPVPITGTAVDPDLILKLDLQRSRYEGPTGIVGVLQDAFGKAGVQSASLWAAVPHYLAVSPNPKAALALVESTARLIGAAADIGELVAATTDYEERIDEIVETDDDIKEYVRLLESRSDDDGADPEELDSSQLPSGDALAAELERFLRERDQGE